MPADEVVATLRQAWHILDEQRVPAALMGGLALAHWGYIRSTQDVDLMIALADLRSSALLARLAAAGYRSKRRDPLIRLPDAQEPPWRSRSICCWRNRLSIARRSNGASRFPILNWDST